MKTLKEYAKENGISYSTAYREHKKGVLNTTIVKGDIYIENQLKSDTLANKKELTNMVLSTAAAESHNSGRVRRESDTTICQYQNML